MADEQDDDVETLTEEVFHDLNNHLAAVNGFATILVNALDKMPQEQEFAAKILESGEDALFLSEQLLTVLKKHFDDRQ